MKDLSVIEAQFARILSFFPRLDAKAAGLFAVNSAILTIASLNLEAGDIFRWYIALTLLLLLIGLTTSYIYLYKCNFPDIKGGEGSILYFVAISGRTESDYREAVEAADEDRYRSDMLAQIWRNSQILSEKYKSVAVAYKLTLATLIPFALFLALTAVEHSRVPIIGR